MKVAARIGLRIARDHCEEEEEDAQTPPKASTTLLSLKSPSVWWKVVAACAVLPSEAGFLSFSARHYPLKGHKIKKKSKTASYPKKNKETRDFKIKNTKEQGKRIFAQKESR